MAEPRAGGAKPGVGRRHGGWTGVRVPGTLASVVSSGAKLFIYVYFCPMCFCKYLTCRPKREQNTGDWLEPPEEEACRGGG